MESDKSVYVLVVVFALVLIIAGGVVIFYVFDTLMSGVKENVKSDKSNALIVTLGRVVQNTPMGVFSEITANQFYKEEISIPIFPQLSKKERHHVIKSIKKYIRI